jgi:hypothetical protein
MEVLSRSPKFRLTFIFLLVSVILALLFSGTVVMGQTVNPPSQVPNTQTGQVVNIAADGKILPQGGVAAAIVHQYDRHQSLVDLVNRLYRE